MSGVDYEKALEEAKILATPALEATADQLKAQFSSAFEELKDSIHKDEVEKLFKEAAEVKLKMFTAKEEDQPTLARIYELKVMAIETYVLSTSIVTDAKAASLFKEMAKQVLDTLGTVASAVLKNVVTGLVSGAIASFTGGGSGGKLADKLKDAIDG